MTPARPELMIACCLAALAPATAGAQSLWPAAGLPAVVHPVASKPVAGPAVLAPFAPLSPGQQCRRAIAAAEQPAGIPHQLMAAIARVESGRRDAGGQVDPWPWSINAEGTDHVFETKAEAIAAVRALQAQGVRSIDVGCMQVNLMYHKDAFATLEDAFDPVANANYAARFLVQLHDQTGTWPAATAWYHSATPELGSDYQRKVMAVWPEEQAKRPDALSGALTGGVVPPRPVTTLPVNGPARPPAARIIPMAEGGTGRSLAAYRAAPIPLAVRPLMRLPLPAATQG